MVMIPDLQQKRFDPAPPPRTIVVRQYLPKDHAQIFAMLYEGFAFGSGSPGETAVRQAMYTCPAFASYAIFLAGGILVFTVDPKLGLALCVAAILAILYLRNSTQRAFYAFCDTAWRTDMVDITAHYQISDGKALGPAGFWVAVIEGALPNGDDEVVGFLGMENLPTALALGHLRRMVVSPRHRRKRIASLIIDAIVAHARKHAPPVMVLELETSAYQPAAHALYLKHGFEVISSRQMRMSALHSVEVFRFRKPVWGAESLTV
ncbi:hypothetical protein MKEN_00177900 [Mycena kentingensis (nom. inval.)]|nr:hypothetical protein MKEN_00177900 [Mycena kentingensis (nom. inval.)]